MTMSLLSAQDVKKVEVVKNDSQISDLFEELGSNELKVDLLDLIASKDFASIYNKVILLNYQAHLYFLKLLTLRNHLRDNLL